MKYGISLLIISFFLQSCYSEKPIVNRQYKDDAQKYHMTGQQIRSAFLHDNYANWFQEEYDAYNPDPTAIAELKKLMKGIKIQIFYGTWCSDSRREVPRFLKILDEVGVHPNYCEMYAVNKKKESFYGEEQGHNILYVPTFIFYNHKNILDASTEINRIIETPVNETLEEDMLKILKQEEVYTPNYYF